MATISTGTVTHVLDQSLGLQISNTTDTGDDVALSTDLHQLPDPFENFLEAIPGLSTDQLNFAANVGAAQETASANTFFVNVTAGSGETINDLFFSDSSGQLFDGQVAKYNTVDIHVVGSTDPIFLYSFASGDILIGSTEAPAGVDISDPATLDRSKIVFAYYLQENGTHTGADVWGVTFQPLDHPIAGDTVAAHDDPIDFGDFLHVTASASLSFNFDKLQSGSSLWAAVGSSSAGLLVTGLHPDVETTGKKTNDSDVIHTSQGGQDATIGVNNQLFDHEGETAVFTLVTGFTELTGQDDGAVGDYIKDNDKGPHADVDYGGYLNVSGAGILISQSQGGPAVAKELDINVFRAGGTPPGTPEKGFGYIDADPDPNNFVNALEDDDEVDVATVTVKNDLNAVVATWAVTPGAGQFASGTSVAGVTVTIDGNNIDVDGVFGKYTISWTTDDPLGFNRFHVVDDNEAAGAFDIGGVDIDKGALTIENIGDKVIVQDDGPTIGPIANSIVDFSVGASSGSVPLAGAPGTDDNSTYTITDFTEQFVVNGVTVNGVLSADKGTVEYFGDDDGTLGPSAGDTKYYTLDLGTTDPGDYTFTVNFAPPAAPLEFNFDELPSGANLFGVVGTSATDPAIIVIGEDPVLKGGNKYANTSDTIHTSQGGTGATIGVNNQLFDNAGEGAYFTYVNDPVQNFLSGAPGGLTSTEADDADNIQYTGGTNEAGGAFFVISQMQGNDLADVKISAFLMGDDFQGVDFVTDGLGTGTTPDITAVRVFDETGTKIEDTDDLANFDDPNVDVDLTGLTATVTGLDAGYKVEWDTDGPHNQVLIENVGGQFDIGRFGISQPQETPDQKLDFTVQIADGDADTDTANFSIGIDGNHDGTVAGVLIV